jgi:hypothetical protein
MHKQSEDSDEAQHRVFVLFFGANFNELARVAAMKSSGRKGKTRNEHSEGGYSGFRIPNSAYELERVSASIDPREFWERFISKRKPCIVEGCLDDASFSGLEKWRDFAHLRRQAGSALVQVEQRSKAQRAFGVGARHTMQLSKLLDHIDADGEELYLTSQNLGLGRDGLDSLLAPPVLQLCADAVLRPALLGKLVPQQLNMWLGRASAGSSSGLHHDYHDNLYVLLAGEKRFRLFSPADAQYMCTHGSVERVYANGLINYAGAAQTRADGADAESTAEYELAVAEAKLLEAEESGDARKIEKANAMLASAEQKLEEVFDGKLDDFDFDDFDEIDAVDDYDDDEEEEKPKKKRKEKKSRKAKNSVKSDAKSGAKRDAKQSEPPHFSQLHLGSDGRVISGPPNEFERATMATATVKQGESLFLPAGWFHEVTSFSTSVRSFVRSFVRSLNRFQRISTWQ